MAIELKPLTPVFGAELTGLDLRTVPGPDMLEMIEQAMNRFAVVVLPSSSTTRMSRPGLPTTCAAVKMRPVGEMMTPLAVPPPV